MLWFCAVAFSMKSDSLLLHFLPFPFPGTTFVGGKFVSRVVDFVDRRREIKDFDSSHFFLSNSIFLIRVQDLFKKDLISFESFEFSWTTAFEFLKTRFKFFR